MTPEEIALEHYLLGLRYYENSDEDEEDIVIEYDLDTTQEEIERDLKARGYEIIKNYLVNPVVTYVCKRIIIEGKEYAVRKGVQSAIEADRIILTLSKRIGGRVFCRTVLGFIPYINAILTGLDVTYTVTDFVADYVNSLTDYKWSVGNVNGWLSSDPSETFLQDHYINYYVEKLVAQQALVYVRELIRGGLDLGKTDARFTLSENLVNKAGVRLPIFEYKNINGHIYKELQGLILGIGATFYNSDIYQGMSNKEYVYEVENNLRTRSIYELKNNQRIIDAGINFDTLKGFYLYKEKCYRKWENNDVYIRLGGDGARNLFIIPNAAYFTFDPSGNISYYDFAFHRVETYYSILIDAIHSSSGTTSISVLAEERQLEGSFLTSAVTNIYTDHGRYGELYSLGILYKSGAVYRRISKMADNIKNTSGYYASSFGYIAGNDITIIKGKNTPDPEDITINYDIDFGLQDITIQEYPNPNPVEYKSTRIPEEPAIEEVEDLPYVDIIPEDDGTIDVPVVPESTAHLVNVYNPSPTALGVFSASLWNLTQQDISQLTLLLQCPMDGIISLMSMHLKPTVKESEGVAVREPYVIGNLVIDLSTSGGSQVLNPKVVDKQFERIPCGSVTIPQFFRNSLDYTATKCNIYLPYIGIKELPAVDVIGKEVAVQYTVDVYTGSFICFVSINDQIKYTYEGNCATMLPLTGQDYTGMLGNLTKTVGSAVTGNAGGAISGFLGVMQSANSIKESGNLTSNCGAMGIQYPYIIITRNIPYNPQGFEEFQGYPSNETVVLSSLTGYTEVKDINLSDIPATDNEKLEIKNLLSGGVIF